MTWLVAYEFQGTHSQCSIYRAYPLLMTKRPSLGNED